MSRFLWPVVLLTLVVPPVRAGEWPPPGGEPSHGRCSGAQARARAEDALVHFEFARGLDNLGPAGGRLTLDGGLGRNGAGHLEFTAADQWAELDEEGTAGLSRLLRKVESLSTGGWFQCRRVGEQVLLGRGELVIGPLGERFFRPSDRFINFCLGTDDRGFFMGTINGNGTMPFVHVTINDVPIPSEA